MKKIVSFALAVIMLFTFGLSANAETETVVQMTCVVKMPDVIREGKYTGEVVNGAPHGYGLFETTNSSGLNWHYIGTWENGNMTGTGGQYWNNGQCTIGTYESGNMVSGFTYTPSSQYIWADYTPDENGHQHIKVYRSDNSIAFDGYVDSASQTFIKGTIYQQNGDVFFSGEFGEGFDFNSIFIQ